jgi:hypothetical protein
MIGCLLQDRFLIFSAYDVIAVEANIATAEGFHSYSLSCVVLLLTAGNRDQYSGAVNQATRH